MVNLNEYGYAPADVEIEECEFDALPDGNYTALIKDIQIGESKSNYKKLEVTYQITEGEFANRKVFDNIWLEFDTSHEKYDMIMNIAKQTIKKMFICATGDENCVDLEQIKFKPFKIRTKTKKSGEYTNTNVTVLMPKKGKEGSVKVEDTVNGATNW